MVNFLKPEGRTEFERLYNWSKIGAVLLDTIPKAQNTSTAKRGGYTVHKVKTLVKKKNTRSYSDFWEWVPEDSRTAEDKLGGVFVVIKGGKITLPNDSMMSKDNLAKIQTELGQPVYGMLYKWRKKVSSSWTGLLDYCKQEIEKLKSDSDVDKYIRYGYTNNAVDWFNGVLFQELLKRKKELKSTVFRAWIDASLEAQKG